MTISGTNTYSGATTINSGILSINSIGNAGTNTAVGNSSAAINIGAGTLRYTGTGHSSARVINITTDGGTIDASGTGTLTLSGGITGTNNNVVLTGTGLGIQSGNITNVNATLTKSGSGTWTLAGTNTYGMGASTIINGGVLAVSSDADLGVVPVAFDFDNIAISNGGILQTTATFTMNANRGIFLNAGGGIIQSTTGTVSLPNLIDTNGNTLTFDTNTGNITSSGGIAGAGSIIKTGTGTLTLNTANTYSGGTTINGGIVVAGNNTALSSNNISINTGSTLRITNGITLGNALILNGTAGAAGTNGLLDTNGTGTATASGVITLAGNTTIGAASGGILNLTNTIDGVSNGGQSLTTTGAGRVIFAGAVGNGSGTALSSLTANALTTLSAGTIRTTGAQSYNTAVTMGGDTTLTSTGSSIGFGALSGAFNLVVNAATSSSLSSVSGLQSLTVTAPSGINYYGNITTIGDLIFNSPLAFVPNFTGVTLQTTGGGNMLISGDSGTYSSATYISSNILTIRGSTSFTYGSYYTASNYIDLAGDVTSGFGMAFNSPLRVTSNSALTNGNGGTSITIASTIDGPGGLTIQPATTGYGGISLNNAIGSNTPLSYLSISCGNCSVTMSGPVSVTNGLSISTNANFGNGVVSFNGPLAPLLVQAPSVLPLVPE